MTQITLFDKPEEFIKSFHEGLGYVRTKEWKNNQSSILVFDTKKPYRHAREVQSIIVSDLKDFFRLYGYTCDGRAYHLTARKPPALATRRFLFENNNHNNCLKRCRVSLAHFVDRLWDVRGAQRRKQSFLHAATPRYAGQQEFLLKFSAPWVDDPKGTIIRTDRRGNKRTILATQEASEEYRTQFLEYLRTADSINAHENPNI